MNLFQWYKYIYYKLYKHFEVGPIKWANASKASLSINVLCIWTFASMVGYYITATKTKAELSAAMPAIWIPTVLIVLFNYFVFNHRNQWREIIHEFDKWDKKKNKIGGWIVFLIVLLVISNLIVSYYAMSRVDWTGLNIDALLHISTSP